MLLSVRHSFHFLHVAKWFRSTLSHFSCRLRFAFGAPLTASCSISIRVTFDCFCFLLVADVNIGQSAVPPPTRRLFYSNWLCCHWIFQVFQVKSNLWCDKWRPSWTILKFGAIFFSFEFMAPNGFSTCSSQLCSLTVFFESNKVVDVARMLPDQRVVTKNQGVDIDPFAFVFASFPRAVSVERSLDVTLPMGISVTFTCRYMQIG